MKIIIDQLSTQTNHLNPIEWSWSTLNSNQLNSTQPNWVKVDNDYWSVPQTHPTPPPHPIPQELLGQFQMAEGSEIWGVT